MKRGTTFRKSVLSKVVLSSIFPVRNPLPSGLNGTNPMPSSSSAGKHLLFGLTPPQRVLALQRGDGLDGMRATNRLHARFGETEVFDLAFANEILHRARDVLDRDVRVDAVLIEQIDPIGLESLQRRVGHLPDVRGPAVQPRLLAALELEAELGRNHHLIANRAERFPDELFIRERPVRFGGIEERDAAVERPRG